MIKADHNLELLFNYMKQEMLEHGMSDQAVTHLTTMFWRTEDPILIILLAKSHNFVQINLLSPAKKYYQKIKNINFYQYIYYNIIPSYIYIYFVAGLLQFYTMKGGCRLDPRNFTLHHYIHYNLR